MAERVDSQFLIQVRRRAFDCCEYCQMPQAVHVRTFPVDHILPRQHGGLSTLDNLALACLRCNSHKGPNLAGIDPDTGQLARLYHPRQDSWDDHFQWNGPLLLGTSDVGRATIDVLTINDPDYVALRDSLIAEGVFPPTL